MSQSCTQGPTLWSNSGSGQSSYTITGVLTASSSGLRSAFVDFCICLDTPGPPTISGVTLGGVAMAIVENSRNVAALTNTVQCKLIGHSLSGAVDLVINLTGAGGYGVSGSYEEWTGTVVAPDVDQHGSAQGSGPTQQVALTSTTAHAAMMSCIATQFAEPTVGSGLAFTLQNFVNEHVAHAGGRMADIGSGGSILIDYASSDLAWTISAITVTEPASGNTVAMGSQTSTWTQGTFSASSTGGGTAAIGSQTNTWTQGTFGVTNSTPSASVPRPPPIPLLGSKTLGPLGLGGFALKFNLVVALNPNVAAAIGAQTDTWTQGTFTASTTGTGTLGSQTTTWTQGTLSSSGAGTVAMGAQTNTWTLGTFTASTTGAATLGSQTSTWSQGAFSAGTFSSPSLGSQTITWTQGSMGIAGGTPGNYAKANMTFNLMGFGAAGT